MAINIGPRIGMDGEPEFRRQINNIVQQCKTLDSEMKNLSSSFDDNDQSQEKLTQQSQILSRQIEAQTKRIELLQKGLDESAKKYGENDTKTLKWRQSVQDATTTLNKLVRELDDVNSAMASSAYDQLTKEIEEQEAEVKRLRTAYQNAVLEFGDASEEAEKLGRELSDTSSELKDSRSAMKRAADAADELDNSLEDAADSADDLEGGFSGLGSIIGGNVIADGISSVVSGLKDLHDETLEYRRIMASLETSSENFGYTSEQTAESYQKLIGVLGDTQTAATTLSNLQAIGLEQEDLNTLIDDAIGAWARYGDSIPIDSLAESVTETINTRQVTGTFADVLNRATGEEDAFNEALQETGDKGEAAQLVLDKLNELDLTHLGEEWQENNESLTEYNKSQDSLQDAMADLAETAEPVLTDITNFLVDMLEVINDISDAAGPVFEFFTADIGGEVFGLGGKNITDIRDGVTELENALAGLNEEQLKQVEIEMQKQNLDPMSIEYQSQMLSLIDQITSSTTEQAESTQVLTESTAAQTEASEAATQMIGAEIQAFQSMSEESQILAVNVTNAVIGMQQSVQEYLGQSGQLFQEFVDTSSISTTALLENFQSQVDGVRTWEENLNTLMNSAKTTAEGVPVELDKNLIQYLADMGPEGAAYVQAFVNMSGDELALANSLWLQSMDIQGFSNEAGLQLQNGIAEIAAGGEAKMSELKSEWESSMKQAGWDITTGLVEGIQSAAEKAPEAMGAIGDDILARLDSVFQFGSPSHVTTQYGSWVAQGLINGMVDYASQAQTAGRQLADAATAGIRTINISTWRDTGYYAALGFANGIRSGNSEAINAASELASAAISAAKSSLDIGSPSKVFEEIGAFTSEGFIIGFQNNDIKKEIGKIMDFQQEHVNAVMSLQYQNVDEIFSVVYRAVKEGMKGVEKRDWDYLKIIDRMSKRPIITQNYMDGRPIGYGVAPYVTTKQQQDAKIRNWVNGVKS